MNQSVGVWGVRVGLLITGLWPRGLLERRWGVELLGGGNLLRNDPLGHLPVVSRRGGEQHTCRRGSCRDRPAQAPGALMTSLIHPASLF